MIDIVRSLFLLLGRLLDRLERREQKREQKERQDARDRAESDPAQYLRDEFGGVRDDADKRDAEQADTSDDHERQ